MNKYSVNHWANLSIDYANQRSYLDDLFQVYPTIPEGIRDIDEDAWERVEDAFNRKSNLDLLIELLSFNLFPIKDSYVAYLKRDPSAIKRNPKTINRLCGRLYEMGLDKIWERCSEPKETNRQIGPMFTNWLSNKGLGMDLVPIGTFVSTNDDAILNASDNGMMQFAKQHLNYNRNKGLDFVARFNGKYVIGETKFLTDFGGHQNAQFSDAINTISTPNVDATLIAILDGVCYIKGRSKMFKQVTQTHSDKNIMSALVLREFLYSL